MRSLPFESAILALAVLSLVALATPYSWATLLAPIALAAGVVIWRWPMLSIAVIVGFVPFAVFRDFGGPGFLSLPKLAGVAGISVAAAHVFFNIRPLSNLKTWFWTPIGFLLAAYLASMAINTGFGDAEAGKSIRQLATAVILFALVLQFEDQLRISLAARALTIIVTAPCIAAFMLDTGNIENNRTSGFLHDPNFFAMLIVMALPLTLALFAIERNRLKKIAWGFAAGIQFTALVQTASRSGLLVLALSSLLALPVLWRFWSNLEAGNRLRALGAVIVVVAIGAATAPPTYFERLERLAGFTAAEETVNDRSLGRRASYWSVGAKMIEASPLIGLGPASFRTEYSKSGAAVQFSSSVEQAAFRRRAHNTYLELAAETGVFGFAAFCAIVIMSILNFRRVAMRSASRRNVEAYLFATGFMISFAAGAISLFFISDQTHKFVWFLAALSVVWERRTRRPAAEAVS